MANTTARGLIISDNQTLMQVPDDAKIGDTGYTP